LGYAKETGFCSYSATYRTERAISEARTGLINRQSRSEAPRKSAEPLLYRCQKTVAEGLSVRRMSILHTLLNRVCSAKKSV
jgi:hypothetical protein